MGRPIAGFKYKKCKCEKSYQSLLVGTLLVCLVVVGVELCLVDEALDGESKVVVI
jgi:hypothetical protein